MNKAFEEILEKLKGEIYNDEFVLYEDVVKVVEEVTKKHNGGWIPCSEMLPEYGEAVMCSCSNGGITISCITHKDVKPLKTVRFGQHSVIAWQPLPESFKENEY